VVHQRGFSGPTGFEGAGWDDENDDAAPATTPPATDTSSDDPSLGVHRAQRRTWWHRHLESSERQRVMAELAIKRQEHWGFRFTVMVTLSVIVAVMGLSANSAAVVIGAMLLAPLMQPVLGTAACIAMSLFRKSLRSFGIVVLATLWSILLSYLLAALFVNGELPNEVTSRTAPDIRDLVVALAAGTAGAYATVRKDASASLPGVAVAVALVPPLGAVGISLEAGNATFAWGAMLLYTTNLFAIVLAGVVVFVVTGFVPPRRLANTFHRTSGVAAAVAVVVVAIALPLYSASTAAVERSEREVDALEIVSVWLGPTDRRSAPSVIFDDQRITVAVRSFDSPPDAEPLIAALQATFGVDRVVSIEWDRVDQATTTTTLVPTTTIVSDEERLAADVESIVDRWLADLDASGRRDALSIAGNVIRLDASGTVDAPALESLTTLLDTELDRTFEVQLTWLKRESVAGEQPPTPDQALSARIDLLARDWATVEQVELLSTSFDGVRAIVQVAGPEAPDATDLVASVSELLGPDDQVTVLFVERRDITTTTTTVPAPPTTTPS
jgi:uncharacterized hydrophobic protein (TIGR00271 family)